jgi:ACS family hexuronate transporter-like MFS transporter
VAAAVQPAVTDSPAGFRVWWPSAVMMLGTVLAYFDRLILALLAPIILRDTHMSAANYGVVLASFSYAYMVSTYCWGPLLDRITVRTGMTIAFLIWAVASFSHSFLTGMLGFAVARAFLGIGEGTIFPGGFRTAMDSLPVSKQARGVAVVYSGSSIGSIVAPLIFIPVAVHYGWQRAFWITPLLAILWLLLFRGTVDPSKYLNKTRPEKLQFPNLTELRFWKMVASYALGALPVGALTNLATLYLNRAHGMKPEQLTYLLWIPPAGMEAGYFFWGWISDRFFPAHPRPTALFVIMGLVMLPTAATNWVASPMAALALMTLGMFASAGFIVVALRTGALAWPRHRQSMAAAVASSSFSLFVAIMMPYFGRFFDEKAFSNVFLILALAPMLGTLVWWVLPSERKTA